MGDYQGYVRRPAEAAHIRCREADKAAKGMGDNEAWDELLELALRISGARSLNRQLVYRSAGPA